MFKQKLNFIVDGDLLYDDDYQTLNEIFITVTKVTQDIKRVIDKTNGKINEVLTTILNSKITNKLIAKYAIHKMKKVSSSNVVAA